MEDFVNFEIAKKLKEKGFREKCVWHYYDDTKDIYKSSSPQCYNYGGNTNDAATISQVLKWLRETHNIHINIYFFRHNGNTELYWVYSVENIKEDYEYDWLFSTKHNTYEEAAMDGIEWVLDNIL